MSRIHLNIIIDYLKTSAGQFALPNKDADKSICDAEFDETEVWSSKDLF